ncbi:hypothetical protein [Pararoseomonas baculiformis]|uniref:hypothetical protein n=1 Tax=Pararoseomonas baculiformis TaxID=2820812 RepID=UPI001AE052EA|nr:hypothetical protein [Pararoseomonas baculiformis]
MKISVLALWLNAIALVALGAVSMAGGPVWNWALLPIAFGMGCLAHDLRRRAKIMGAW